jgi:dTDP-4-amino-4,6-dideoxygalactose transaminase
LQEGVDTSKLFSKTPEVAKVHYGYQGNCIYTEKMAKRILTIPNFYTLKEKERKKIVEIVKVCMSSE